MTSERRVNRGAKGINFDEKTVFGLCGSTVRSVGKSTSSADANGTSGAVEQQCNI